MTPEFTEFATVICSVPRVDNVAAVYTICGVILLPANNPDGVTTVVATDPLVSAGVTFVGSISVKSAPAIDVLAGNVPVRFIFRVAVVLTTESAAKLAM